MREFSTATRRGRAGVPNAVDIPFKIDGHKLTAHAPTTGQVALFIQHGANGGYKSVQGLFEFFSDILNDADWKVVENLLRDGIDIEVLAEVSNYLIGEWSGRPTSPPSDSSPTRNGTGRRSTGKRPRTVSTSSSSLSTGSATSSNGGSSKG